MSRYCVIYALVFLTSGAFAGVTVTAPHSGAVLGSPVNFAATATSTCSKGVASMGVYIDNQLTYVSNGTSLHTTLAFDPGPYHTVIEEWDYCGGASFTPIDITVADKTGVWVTSPSNNATVGSPVNYVATSHTTACSKGVASMGVYVENQLKFVSNGANLNTKLWLNPGTYNTVVEEWDYCGGAAYTPVRVTVKGRSGPSVLSNLQASGGWIGYGEFPPDYNICSSCGPGVTYSMAQGIKSPSMSGNATQFNIGGDTPYSDVLWTNALIGQNTSQGLPDSNHTLIPSLHNYTYDAYFYGKNLGLSQVLEFDISQYANGQSLIWGHQCRIAGGNEWDIWDNVNHRWVPTGAACKPVNNSWNHVRLQVQRTSDNRLFFHSISLNGVTSTINQYYEPASAPAGWYGITVNFQQDGNSRQSPYSIWLDKFSFTYW